MTGRPGFAFLLLVAALLACALPSSAPPPAAPPEPAATPTAQPPAAEPTRAPVQYGEEVAAVVPIGGNATGVAVGHGSVWVTNHRDSTLLRIDPTTMEVLATIPVGSNPGPIAIGEDMVWVAEYGASGEAAGLTRVDPATNEVVAAVRPPGLCCDLAIGHGSLWATNAATVLVRVDLATNEVAELIPVPQTAPLGGVLASEGAVWGAGDHSKIWRVDPESKQVVAQIDVDGGKPFAVGDGTLWGVWRDSVWGIDLDTDLVIIQIRRTAEVVRFLDAGAFGDGVVWIAAEVYGGDGTHTALLKINPNRREVAQIIPIGPTPSRIAVGEGAVWVTDFDQGVLLKVVPDP